jgi:hypothetical protein
LSFDTTIWGSHGAEKVVSAGKKYSLGTRMVLPDGRSFRYAYNGGVALHAGVVLQSMVDDTQFKDMVVPAAVAAGATTLTITNGTTAVVANDFAGGFLSVNDVDGEGHCYKVKSNTAAVSGAAITVVLDSEDAIKVALTTSSEVILQKNLLNGVIIYPTTPTGVPVGVATVTVPINYYCWVQTWGVASVLSAGTVVIGNNVVPMTTAGGVGVSVAHVLPNIGWVMRVAVATEYANIFLIIAP